MKARDGEAKRGAKEIAITACRHEGPIPTRKTHEKLKGGVANPRNDPNYFQKCELEQGVTNLSQNGYGKNIVPLLVLEETPVLALSTPSNSM